MRRRQWLGRGLATLAGALAGGSAVTRAAGSGLTSDFSSMPAGAKMPPGWEIQRFSSVEPNRFALAEEDSRRVLRIDSKRSASSLIHRLEPPRLAARLAWHWRTDAWPATTATIQEKSGDDFSLRLYLMFDYPLSKLPAGERLMLQMARAIHSPWLPAASLCYVADPRVPAGTLVDSAFTSRVKLLVLRGDRVPGPWWAEDRDLQADFQRAFGREHGPGMPPISAVALAADTDQGGGELRAWFSDLRWSIP